MDLTGKVALITGAARGLGEEIARAFGKAGATLGLVDRDEDGARTTLSAAGGRGVAIGADVTDDGSVTRAVAAIVAEAGPVDIVVNNAGIAGAGGPKLLHETEPEEWATVLSVNLTAPYLVSRAVLPAMLERRSGVFVNVASAAGVVAFPTRVPYATSKAALIHFTRTLAVEYAPHGIRANALCPGWMDTPLTRWRFQDPDALAAVVATIPVGRVATPAEMAEAALFLASESSRYMTGQALVIDGGWTAP